MIVETIVLTLTVVENVEEALLRINVECAMVMAQAVMDFVKSIVLVNAMVLLWKICVESALEIVARVPVVANLVPVTLMQML
jgi:hypothetical protein